MNQASTVPIRTLTTAAIESSILVRWRWSRTQPRKGGWLRWWFGFGRGFGGQEDEETVVLSSHKDADWFREARTHPLAAKPLLFVQVLP